MHVATRCAYHRKSPVPDVRRPSVDLRQCIEGGSHSSCLFCSQVEERMSHGGLDHEGGSGSGDSHQVRHPVLQEHRKQFGPAHFRSEHVGGFSYQGASWSEHRQPHIHLQFRQGYDRHEPNRRPDRKFRGNPSTVRICELNHLLSRGTASINAVSAPALKLLEYRQFSCPWRCLQLSGHNYLI